MTAIEETKALVVLYSVVRSDMRPTKDQLKALDRQRDADKTAHSFCE
jgi:hypothetical protein